MLSVIKFLAAATLFFVLLQFFLYATNRATAEERKSYCMPFGIILFAVSIAGFASRNIFFAFFSVVLVALSLWLGPTTWRGKKETDPPLLPVENTEPDRFEGAAFDARPKAACAESAEADPSVAQRC